MPMQDLSKEEYEAKKESVAAALIKRLDKVFPGLEANVVLKEVSTWRVGCMGFAWAA